MTNNLTPEQYYWYVYRQRLMNAASRIYAANVYNPLEDEIKKSYRPLEISDPSFAELPNSKYALGSIEVSSYSDYPSDLFQKFDPGKDHSESNPCFRPRSRFGLCSSMRSGNFHGRNFDWTLDYEPEFVVFTPHTDKRYATIGIADSMTLTWEDVKNMAENGTYKSDFDKIVYQTMDGMNETGFVCNVNVVPVNDDPCDPLNPHGGNKTTSTAHGRDLTRIAVAQLNRLFLDYAKNCDEAIAIANNHDLYAMFGMMGEIPFAEEFHIMCSDANETCIIEFVHNHVVVSRHKRENDWKFKNRLPIMTNFHVTGFDGNVSNIALSDIWMDGNHANETLTRHAMGTERYKILYEKYEESGKSMEQMLETMESIKYTNGYDESNPWYSEFLDEYTMYKGKYPPLRLDSPKKDFIGTEDKPGVPTLMINAFKNAGSDKARRDKFGGLSFWQSINTSVYDLENKELLLCSQERYDDGFLFGWNPIKRTFEHLIVQTED